MHQVCCPVVAAALTGPVDMQAYSKSYDLAENALDWASYDANPTTYASTVTQESFKHLNELSYIKVPIDITVFLYPPMHYCAKGCDNRNAMENDPLLRSCAADSHHATTCMQSRHCTHSLMFASLYLPLYLSCSLLSCCRARCL